MPAACPFVNYLATGKQFVLFTVVALRRRDKADGAVPVNSVVSLDEAKHPVPCSLEGGEGLLRVLRSVLQRAEA